MFGFQRKGKKKGHVVAPIDEIEAELKPVPPCVNVRYERGQRIDEITFTNGKTYERKYNRKDPMKRFASQLTRRF